MFIAVFRRTCHWFLSWARRIQSAQSYPGSLRVLLILFSSVRLGFQVAFFFRFSTKILYAFFICINACYIPRPLHYCIDRPNHIWWKEKLWSSSLCLFFLPALSPAVQCLEFQVYLCLVSRLKMGEALPTFLDTSSWNGTEEHEQVYILVDTFSFTRIFFLILREYRKCKWSFIKNWQELPLFMEVKLGY